MQVAHERRGGALEVCDQRGLVRVWVRVGARVRVEVRARVRVSCLGAIRAALLCMRA